MFRGVSGRPLRPYTFEQKKELHRHKLKADDMAEFTLTRFQGQTLKTGKSIDSQVNYFIKETDSIIREKTYHAEKYPEDFESFQGEDKEFPIERIVSDALD